MYGTSDRKVYCSFTTTHTALLRRLERLRCRGRARHDSHRRGTGERRSDGCNLELALQYGNHPSDTEHLPTIWKKMGEGVRRQTCLVTHKSAAHNSLESKSISVGGRLDTHKVRTVNDFSFAEQSRRKKGGRSKQRH